MTANELRIGNFYSQYGYVHQADWGTIKELSKGAKNQLWCKAIPITEEWLLKFGFDFEELGEDPTPEEENYRSAIKGYGSKSFEIEFNKNEGYFILAFIIGEVINYQYVHQLQNLYFLLTGKELEL